MHARTLAIGLVTSATLVGCSSTAVEDSGRLTLRLAGLGAAAPAAMLAADDDVLVVETVQVVARKIKLRRAAGSCTDPDDEPDDGDGTGDDPEGDTGGDDQAAGSAAGSTEQDDDDEDSGPGCPVVWMGPVLLEPPVTPDAATVFTVDLPEGTYREVRLQIHKPTGSSRDAAFLAQHPDFQGVSVRVTGTFNGAPFTFESRITSVVKMVLDEPVDVAPDAPATATLSIDIGSWFVARDGSLIDPTSPSPQARARVEQNVRRSFRVHP